MRKGFVRRVQLAAEPPPGPWDVSSPMRGDIPDAVRADERFRQLFTAWKFAGGKKDDPRVALMRSRWAFLTQEHNHARSLALNSS